MISGRPDITSSGYPNEGICSRRLERPSSNLTYNRKIGPAKGDGGQGVERGRFFAEMLKNAVINVNTLTKKTQPQLAPILRKR